MASRTARLAALQAELQRTDPATLSGEDALNHAVLAWRVDSDLRLAKFDEARIPFTSDEGFFVTATSAADGTVLRSRAQAEAWLARLSALPAYYDTEIANMRRGLRTGFVQPGITAAAASRSTRDEADVPAAHDPLLAPLDALPATMPEADRRALQQRGLAIIRTRVKPAEAALADFFAHTYLPAARDTIGRGPCRTAAPTTRPWCGARPPPT